MSAKDAKQDFEKQLKRLQQVVQELEAGDLPLEKGVALYKEGMVLAKACREQLATAKHEITVLAADGTFTPLEDTEENAEEQS